MADAENDEAFPLLFRNSSIDDLRFEVKRLQQKYDVLERDKKILEDERAIAALSTNDGSMIDRLSKELTDKNVEVLKWYESASAMAQKHRVVLRHLWLEKRALREMKIELAKGMSSIFNSSETAVALAALREGLTSMQSGLEKLAREASDSHKKISNVAKIAITALSIVKNQRESLNDIKDMVRSEFQEWDIYFQGIKRAIASASAKMSSTAEETKEALQTLKIEYNILSKEHNNLKIEHESSLNKVRASEVKWSEMKQQHDADMTALIARNKEMEMDSTKLQSENQELQGRNTNIMQKLQTSLEQMRRLAEIHESTQHELQSSMQREQDLKKELDSNGSSKNEISSRLKRIQDKVNAMEEEHARQMKGLEAEVAAERAAHATSKHAHDCALRRMHDDMAEIIVTHKLEIETWKTKYSSLEEKQHDNVVRDRNVKIKIAEQDGLISSLRSRITELELRDEEEAGKRTEAEAEISKKAIAFREAEAARVSILMELNALKEKIQSDNSSAEKDKQISDTKAEVARLLMVVQKECQERTDLLIQISELKDQLRDNSIMKGRGGEVGSGSTAYAHISPIGGLSQDKINSGLVSSFGDAVPSSEKRLVDAINYSRTIDADNSEPASSDVWTQRLKHAGHGSGTRGGRKSTRGHYR